MHDVALIWDPAMAAYDLGPTHPLKPVRVLLAVELMRALGLLDESGAEFGAAVADVVAPRQATDDEIALVHDREYMEVVKRASDDPEGAWTHGLGPGDTPAFEGMHDAAALVAGGAIVALDEVLEGRHRRTFNVGGGLHHAQRDRASGFCVYNDPAIAIAKALQARPDLRIAYVDIDAHHGDGVEAAFYDEPRVLTASMHQSGRYLFPGTGFAEDIGRGPGLGFALNVPMPPLADDGSYRLAFDAVVAPALRAFAPDIIVAQCGADAHHDDPLTQLGLTVSGHRALVRRIVALADELCHGRINACGGGGYGVYRAVPRMWALVLAELLGAHVAEHAPEPWRRHVESLSGESAPETLTGDEFELSSERAVKVRGETEALVERLVARHPLLREVPIPSPT